MNANEVTAELTALFRARNGLLWVVSKEEERVERRIFAAAAKANFQTYFWDCATGITHFGDDRLVLDAMVNDPVSALNWIKQNKSRAVYVLRDMHKQLDPMTLRTLQSFAREFQARPNNNACAMVILSPSSEIPPELTGHITVIDFPLPDREELGKLLESSIEINVRTLENYKEPKFDADIKRLREMVRLPIIEASLGLSFEEAQNIYAKLLVISRDIDPVLVAQEKKRVIAREKVLTWHDPEPAGMSAIGGLDLLKGWLNARKNAFSSAARAFGLPPPKGVLIAGIPGTGKSLTAKCIAAAWQVPLLRLDLGALRSKYVGDSEANIRKALAVADAIGNCVVWLDEIEKALGGSTGPQGDGGVSADALGTILSWMQEKKGSSFVIATANDIRSLPPELLRKGRFDEIFWVDLPTRSERVEILEATLRSFKRDPNTIDSNQLAEATRNFTGAEISALVPDGLYRAFAEDCRTLTSEDLLLAAKQVVPLAVTMADKLKELRAEMKGKARMASSLEPEESIAINVRELDF